MSEVKLYCGSGKVVGQYGVISMSVCLDELPQEYITTAKNGKRYINIKCCPKKEDDQFGKTHYLEIDTWKPNQKKTSNGQNNWANSAPLDGNNIPF